MFGFGKPRFKGVDKKYISDPEHIEDYEATQAIRAMDRPDAASIPIIAMTADAFSEDIRHCLESGMNAHIAKPIDIKALLNLIQQHLSGR